jgi:hypothetical protein
MTYLYYPVSVREVNFYFLSLIKHEAVRRQPVALFGTVESDMWHCGETDVTPQLPYNHGVKTQWKLGHLSWDGGMGIWNSGGLV